MWCLLRIEFMRFRTWAILAALVHLGALAFFARIADLGQQPLWMHWVVGGVYGLAGWLLGVYHVGSYRRPSQWLSLLHRPLPHEHIAIAFIATGGLLMLLAVVLPLLLIAVWQCKIAGHVVDVRHWLLALSALCVAMSGYLAGAFCVLRGPRQAAAALALLAWPVFARATGVGMIAVELVALFWLGALLIEAFRPNPEAPVDGVRATLLLAIPLSMGIYMLMVLVLFALELVWIAQGSHPLNMAVPPPGGHIEVEKMEPRKRMLAALRDSRYPDAGQLAIAVKSAKPSGLDIRLGKQPQRNELANVAPMRFDDAERNIRWVFSHDSMRLNGYSLLDGQFVGSLGVAVQGHAFPRVVLPIGNLSGWPGSDVALVGGDTLYRYASSEKKVLPYVSVDAGEVLAGLGRVGSRMMLLSDRALYFVEPAHDGVVARKRVRIPLPGAIGDLSKLDLIELPDGYLVCLTYSEQAHAADGAVPAILLLRVRADGRSDIVQWRKLAFDYPAIHRYRVWWPSPVLHLLQEYAKALFAPNSRLTVTAPGPMPSGIGLLAIGLMLASAVAASMRLRLTHLSRRMRIAWQVACGVLGLPALVCLWLLVPRIAVCQRGSNHGVIPDSPSGCVPAT